VSTTPKPRWWTSSMIIRGISWLRSPVRPPPVSGLGRLRSSYSAGRITGTQGLSITRVAFAIAVVVELLDLGSLGSCPQGLTPIGIGVDWRPPLVTYVTNAVPV
jgi:hypothetical protein